VLYACKGAQLHTPSSLVREREREREEERYNMVIEFISLLLTMTAFKGMTGALAPFSYLVLKILIEATGHPNE
jgi:hypothetical protein